MGTAPQATRPGPGVWDWGLFWGVVLGYALMGLVAQVLLAIAQRSKPRGKRLGPGGIFWRSLVWWAFIFTAAAQAWGQVIASATLTRGEKHDDRIAALAQRNAELEAQLRDPE